MVLKKLNFLKTRHPPLIRQANDEQIRENSSVSNEKWKWQKRLNFQLFSATYHRFLQPIFRVPSVQKKNGACPQNVRCDFLYVFILFHKRQLRRRWLDFLPLSSLNIKKGKKIPLQSVSEKTHSLTFAKRNVFFYFFFFLRTNFLLVIMAALKAPQGKYQRLLTPSAYLFAVFMLSPLPAIQHNFICLLKKELKAVFCCILFFYVRFSSLCFWMREIVFYVRLRWRKISLKGED